MIRDGLTRRVVLKTAGVVAGIASLTGISGANAGRIEFGETKTGNITAGDPEDPAWDGYHTEPWTFNATAGGQATVELTFYSNAEPWIHIDSPDGGDLHNSEGGEATIQLQSTGDYTIYPQGASGWETPGEYELTLTGSSGDGDDGEGGETDEDADAQIGWFFVEDGTYSEGEVVSASVEIENTGETTHTFFVGFSVQGPDGEYYDNNGETGQYVELDPGEDEWINLSWTVQAEAEAADNYDAVTKVWKDGDPPEGHLDTEWDNDGFDVTGTSGGGSADLSGKAMYVWGAASEVVSEGADAFTDEMEQFGVERVFLSWGGLTEYQRDPDDDTLSDFIEECEDDGVEISLMWGEERGVSGISHALADIEPMIEHSPSGIHLDIEPKKPENREVYLAGFLDFYATLLEHIDPGIVDLSAYVNPYWGEQSSYFAKQIFTHDNLDRLVISAYQDSPSEIREKINDVRDLGVDKEYYAAVELQDPFAVDAVEPSITLWEEAEQAGTIIEDVANDPPDEYDFLGMALHDYAAVTSGHY